MREYKFTVVVERDDDGAFLAICPAMQGCYAEGDTAEEALEHIEDVIRLHIEDRRARGERVYEEVLSTEVAVAL